MRTGLAPLLLSLALLAPALPGVGAQDQPDGPSQMCRDDAGPPWGDVDTPFWVGTPARVEVHNGDSCPPPLAGACATKGNLGAHLAGPVDCGGQGWVCRIMPQDGWTNPDYSDRNFAHCNSSTADERDNDGHCHGSDTDDVYGWWVRDHWHRGYTGTLHCCCDWRLNEGLVNRCDYRKHVTPEVLETCRDANEEHNQGYEGTCEAHSDVPFVDPVGTSDQCWSVKYFANPESVPEYVPGVYPPPAPSPAPAAVPTSVQLHSTNACPSGSSPILSMPECRAAMQLVGEAGDDFRGTEEANDWPAGCYKCDGVTGCQDGTWFNTHSTGSAVAGTQQYCVADGDAGFQTGRDVFVGDSDVSLWDVTADFPLAYNVGIGGYTCADVLAESAAMIAALQPGRIVLVCGENDLAVGSTVDSTFGRFVDVVAAYTAAGARVLYMGTKPEPSMTGLHGQYQQYDALIRAHAAGLASATSSPPPLAMVDVYPAFVALGNPASLYASDQLHLSATGYGLWTTWAATGLGQVADDGCVLWESNACSSPQPTPTATPAEDVVINELMPNPCGQQGSDTEYEYVELFNPNCAAADLSGYQLDSAVLYTFPDGATIPARGHIIVAKDPDVWSSLDASAVFGPFSGLLQNGGEQLNLLRGDGAIADSASYGDVSDQTTCGSLELQDPALDNSQAASWAASCATYGSPGGRNGQDDCGVCGGDGSTCQSPDADPCAPTASPPPLPTPSTSTDPTVVDIAWTLPMQTTEFTARVGDVLVFSWNGYHNVRPMSNESCESWSDIPSLPTSPFRRTIDAAEAGQLLRFGCSVGFHCEGGMTATVQVEPAGGVGLCEGGGGAPMTISMAALAEAGLSGEPGGLCVGDA